VAGFIGSPAMNLLKAQGDGDAIRVGGARIPLGRAAPSGPVTAGIRAQDIRPAENGDPALTARIAYVEELGSERIVHCEIEGQRLAMTTSSGDPLGEQIAIAIPPQALHLFSEQDGRRLD